MIPLIILGGLVLLGTPGWASGLSKRGHPANWVRQGLVLQLTGFALVEAGLLLWATPALLELMGAADLALICRRMLGGWLPSGRLSNAGAGLLAIAVVWLAARGSWRVMAAQRRLRVERWLGAHHHREDFDLVVVPTGELVAYTVAGRPPQVVLSRGLLQAVDSEDLEAITAHEAVHVRRQHYRFLLAISAVEAAFGWYRPAARGSQLIRFMLERWADEEAAVTSSTGRDGLRRVLVTVAMTPVATELTGFGAVDTITERAQALSRPASRSSCAGSAATYIAVSLGAVLAAGWLAWATWMSILAVANPGLCVV
ncbi:MAG TPA: M56 family metallopeptidase [Acidimicrobiia bacterium]|nr:M56 family metallopeptidase [Acidimicrobiia bacterium]